MINEVDFAETDELATTDADDFYEVSLGVVAALSPTAWAPPTTPKVKTSWRDVITAGAAPKAMVVAPAPVVKPPPAVVPPVVKHPVATVEKHPVVASATTTMPAPTVIRTAAVAPLPDFSMPKTAALLTMPGPAPSAKKKGMSKEAKIAIGVGAGIGTLLLVYMVTRSRS
jgi:hypothetical protein